MEASENGLIKEYIKWRGTETIVNLINSIIFRKSLGDMLTECIDLVASKIKVDFTIHIK